MKIGVFAQTIKMFHGIKWGDAERYDISDYRFDNDFDELANGYEGWQYAVSRYQPDGYSYISTQEVPAKATYYKNGQIAAVKWYSAWADGEMDFIDRGARPVWIEWDQRGNVMKSFTFQEIKDRKNL